MKKYFINKIISYCYPYDIARVTKDYGVLEQYIGKQYSRKEIDKIICQLIIKHPYVEKSMSLNINIMWESETTVGYYHMLTFKNDNFKHQTKGDLVIRFEKS